jgi:hypothetical protein
MFDWLCDVPHEIIEELKKYGLSVTAKIGGCPISAVETMIAVKGNALVIESLTIAGWKKTWGFIRDGKKYIHMQKQL